MYKLIATQLREDPRVKQARDLLLEALQDHKKQITHVRPAENELAVAYEELLTHFMELRGGKLYFPYIGSGIGNGALVELLDGSVKYDMISGIGAHYWGHSHPQLMLSSIDAALSDTIMQGHLQQNKDAVELSELLIQTSGLDHCFLSSSGVMANENALKLAFHKKGPAAQRILVFERCFMGRTLTLSQITDKPGFREGLPLNVLVDYIPFYEETRPEESTERAISALKTYLSRYPNQHAAMCFELIQGEAGFYAGSTNFFQTLMQILKEHGIPIIVDEVQTFGRTPNLFAYQYFQLEDYVDIVSIGKLSQVCATLFRKEFKSKPGLLSQTFTSSTTAIRASIVIIQSLIKEDYLGPNGKIAQVHAQFVTHFGQMEKEHPHLIEGPYGIGTMIAFTPYEGDLHKTTHFIQRLFQVGVIGFIAGHHPSRVRFLVPIGAITPEDIKKITHLVEETLKQGLLEPIHIV